LDCGPYVIMKGLVDLPGYERLRQKSASDPLFMPIVTVKTADVDSFTRIARPLAMEILVGHDSTYLTSESALQMFRDIGCHIWFNALFDQIAAGRSERKNKTASWDYFIGLDARFIQTDYPVELMQHLVSKGLRSPPVVVVDFENAESSMKTNNAGAEKSMHTKRRKYVVRKGDTLSMIAHRNKVTVSVILKLNPELKKNTTLSIGQVILLPTR
jgi:LysM repeat protein